MTAVMSLRRPPMPQVFHAGVCTWCAGEIVYPETHKRAGERNRRRRWHPDCVIAYKLAISSTEQRRAVFARDHGRCAECGASKRRKVVVRWRVRRYRSADAIVRAALRRRCPTPIVISGCFSGVDPVLSMPWAADHIIPLWQAPRHLPLPSATDSGA